MSLGKKIKGLFGTGAVDSSATPPPSSPPSGPALARVIAEAMHKRQVLDAEKIETAIRPLARVIELFELLELHGTEVTAGEREELADLLAKERVGVLGRCRSVPAIDEAERLAKIPRLRAALQRLLTDAPEIEARHSEALTELRVAERDAGVAEQKRAAAAQAAKTTYARARAARRAGAALAEFEARVAHLVEGSGSIPSLISLAEDAVEWEDPRRRERAPRDANLGGRCRCELITRSCDLELPAAARDAAPAATAQSTA